MGYLIDKENTNITVTGELNRIKSLASILVSFLDLSDEERFVHKEIGQKRLDELEGQKKYVKMNFFSVPVIVVVSNNSLLYAPSKVLSKNQRQKHFKQMIDLFDKAYIN